jgi:SAM-dependent methyltransferase
VLSRVNEDGFEQITLTPEFAIDRRNLHEIGPRSGDEQHPGSRWHRVRRLSLASRHCQGKHTSCAGHACRIGPVKSDWVTERYTGRAYHEKNPTWDLEDAPWKASQVQKLLSAHDIRAATIAEIGCGAGGVLAELRRSYPEAELYGFDIAPALVQFWEKYRPQRIQFALGDFLSINTARYEVVLLLDVLEHLANPFDFLTRIRGAADHFVIHFPLDLSALAILQEAPLLHVRNRVGHLHYFTKGLALALLAESGYTVVDWKYTGATFTAPQRTWKTRLASAARLLAYAANKDLGVRLLGGETLIVLVRPAAAA